MGDYFCLKKLERAAKKMYFLTMESDVKCDKKKCEEYLNSTQEVSGVITQMREVFREELTDYEASRDAYESNRKNGYYDKGFGIIEGWFYKEIYLKIHFRRYEEYFSILDRSERLIKMIMIRLSFQLTQKG